ncbi:MAG: L,D-transpeptidase family protein [Pseudomonadota bacterium]
MLNAATRACALTLSAVIAASFMLSPGEAQAKKALKGTAKQPLVIVISIGSQRLKVYRGIEQIATAPVSTGKRGKPTPRGVFSIIQKNRRHFSNLYNNAPMPFMQRVTWSGIALHAGALPGYPASHGCIRMPYGFARKLFGMTDMYTRVIIDTSGPRPRAFAHAKLFRPLPPLLAPDAAPPADNVPPPAGIPVGENNGIRELTASAYKPSSGAFANPDLAKLRQTRHQLALARLAKIKALESARSAAITAADASVTVVKETKIALRQAGRRAIDARNTWRNAIRAVKLRTRDVAKAAAALAQLERRFRSNVVKVSAVAELGAREDELDTLLAQRHDALDTARRNVGKLKSQYDLDRRSIGDIKQRIREAALTAKERKKAAAAAVKAHKAALRAEKMRERPLAILISRKTKRLYVRQGQAPLFNTPVEIADPDKPLGTHVFTALRFRNADKTELNWSVISTNRAYKRKRIVTRRGRRRRVTYKTIPLAGVNPADALDRVTIPAEARMRIAELIKPGSSLILTDRPVSRETGNYTDLIIEW